MQYNNSTYAVEIIVLIVSVHIPFPDYHIVLDTQAGPQTSVEKRIHPGSNLAVPPAVLSQCYEVYCPLEDRLSSKLFHADVLLLIAHDRMLVKNKKGYFQDIYILYSKPENRYMVVCREKVKATEQIGKGITLPILMEKQYAQHMK